MIGPRAGPVTGELPGGGDAVAGRLLVPYVDDVVRELSAQIVDHRLQAVPGRTQTSTFLFELVSFQLSEIHPDPSWVVVHRQPYPDRTAASPRYGPGH